MRAAVFRPERWAQTTAMDCEAILLKAADWMAAHIDEVAQMLMSESGSAFGKAYFEAGFAVDIFRTAAGECRRLFGEVQQQTPGEISMIRRLPLGVVAGIAPFNFPLLLAFKKVAFALAAGNTFVLKPASATPVSGVMIAKALDAAGLPAGVFNLVPGSGETVGNRLIEEKRVKMVAFTGSTAVGRSNVQNELANWFGDYFKNLKILFKSNLSTNGAIMVQNGLGYSLVVEGSIPFWDEEKICSRPLYPELSATSVLAWKRQQPFSRAAMKFIEHIKCFLSMNQP